VCVIQLISCLALVRGVVGVRVGSADLLPVREVVTAVLSSILMVNVGDELNQSAIRMCSRHLSYVCLPAHCMCGPRPYDLRYRSLITPASQQQPVGAVATPVVHSFKLKACVALVLVATGADV
jgi:hypothetical protein